MAEKYERPEYPGIWLPEGVEVRDVLDGRKVSAYVDPSLIEVEEAAVDFDHVDDLAASIKKGVERGDRSGQESPISIHEIPDYPLYPIADGFHRVPAAQKAESEVWATIVLGSSWAEMLDKRILSTTTHRGVRFARLVEWMDRAWALTEWGDMLKLEQACNMVINPEMTGAKLEIPAEASNEIRGWIQDRSREWHLSPTQIRQYLEIARVIDPELVKEAREGADARRYGTVSPPQLRIIGGILPNDYERQRIVAEIAAKEQLSSPDTQVAASYLKRIVDFDEVRRMLQEDTWRNALSLAARKSGYWGIGGEKRKRKSTYTSSAITVKEWQQMLFDAELKVARFALREVVLEGRYIAPPLEQKETSAEVTLPTLFGSEARSNAWTDDMINQFRQIMDESDEGSLSYLQNSGLNPEDAINKLKRAKQRLVSDIENGALRYVPTGNKFLITRLLGLSLQHEAMIQNDFATRKRSRPTRPDTAKGSSDERVITIPTVQKLIPELGARERQALILGAFFNLSAYTIAQVIRSDERDVSETFAELHKRLRTRTVSRSKVRAPAQISLDLVGSPEQLRSQIKLSSTEEQIIQLVALGFDDEEIAANRSSSLLQVRTRVETIIEKTGLKTRAELRDLAHSLGLLADLSFLE